MNKRILICNILVSLFSISSCNSTNDANSSLNSETSLNDSDLSEKASSTDKQSTYVNIYPISYQEVNHERNMEKFYKETKNDNGSSHDTPLEYGFVDSIWHKLKINNFDVPVYSARSGYGIHSFAWIDIDTDGLFELDIDLKLTTGNFSKVDVLPEKKGITASISNKNIKSTINQYGDFSFVFDELPDMALTLYVSEETKFELPNGYTLQELTPGEYNNTLEGLSTEFKNENTAYYFKSGVYDVTSINLPSNSIAYFERGTYFRVFEGFENDYKYVLGSAGTNVKILGRSLFDISKVMGGDAKTKGVYNFTGSNVYIEGITTINSNTWTMCFTAADNCEVTKCMFFGYRTYSDGIMFSDCQDSYAHDNFVRTGDDAFECKAFSGTSEKTNNITFENNTAWTDKGIAYGCIYESVHDIENVFFRNNSVGFAQASWSNHLGCCVVQMGSMYQQTWHDIYFENMEIYSTSCAAISVFNRALDDKQGGKIKNIYFKNINVKNTRLLNLPVYCINIVISLAEGVSFRNATISNIYIDNVSYQGTIISKENYEEYTNIALSEDAMFSKSALKINTLG